MAKLYFYYAAMNAGKSTNLLQSAHNYEERNMKTLIFTPKLDDRFGEGKVTSRIGLERDVERFEGEDDLYVWTAHEHQREKVSCILFNPGAFTHTSVALRDAILGVDIPLIEIHISNIFNREAFREKSYFSDIAVGIISGFGEKGYKAALELAIERF